MNMLPATTIRLANDCPNIIGIKEASGIVGQIDAVSKQRPNGFFVLAGDDTITFPLMTMGVDGVISVIGNAFPHEFGRMVHLIEEKQYAKALKIHPFFKAVSYTHLDVYQRQGISLVFCTYPEVSCEMADTPKA